MEWTSEIFVNPSLPKEHASVEAMRCTFNVTPHFSINPEIIESTNVSSFDFSTYGYAIEKLEVVKDF